MSEGKRFIVAIDGPAGAGKSTLASRIAARFHLLNLETGAMYRAFALKAIQQGVPPEDPAALGRLATETTIRLQATQGGNRVFLDGGEVTGQLRAAGVTEAASKVSVHPAIRKWMVSLQRELGQQGRIVMEGRDIGTAVFPDADVKIFLDADPEVRGQRRYEQIGPNEKANSAAPVQEAVLREMRERDERDRTREQSPLKPANDAVVIDSTRLSLEQVVERVEAIIRERMGLE